MHEKLKSLNFVDEGSRIVELCEDWWELLRQEASLFEVYVSCYYSSKTCQKIFKDEST
jgi:hypothetical protein